MSLVSSGEAATARAVSAPRASGHKHMLTTEQQFRACGCFFVLLVALAGVIWSSSMFIQVSASTI